MNKSNFYKLIFSVVYPLYITKVEKKGETKKEVDQIISWLTGYSLKDIEYHVNHQPSFDLFFTNAPHMNPQRKLITGVICGDRVESIDDILVQNIRYLDKLIDELAKGRPLTKILRTSIK